MSNLVFVACFEGQFGPFLSPGIPYMSGQLNKQLGIIADTYQYQNVHDALMNIQHYRSLGYKIMLVGYSLGCSTITWIQQYYKVDTLIAIAESTLALNYKIVPANTKRAILYYGTDFLSRAGQDDPGYVQKIPVDHNLIPILQHLSIDVTGLVIQGVLAECAKLQKA